MLECFLIASTVLDARLLINLSVLKGNLYADCGFLSVVREVLHLGSAVAMKEEWKRVGELPVAYSHSYS